MKTLLYISLYLLTICSVYSEVYVNSTSSNLCYDDYCKITWSENDFEGNVSIELWDVSRGKYYLLCRTIDSKRLYYDWHISNYSWVGEMFRIKITEQSNKSKYKMTRTYFSINNCNNKPPINAVEDDNPLKIFPNPTIDKVYVKLESLEDEAYFDFKLVNSSGLEVYKTYVNNNSLLYGYQLDTSQYPNGCYIVEIKGRKSSYSNKFIKTNN